MTPDSPPMSINARLLRSVSGRASGVVTSTQAGLMAAGAEAVAQLPGGLADLVEVLVGDGARVEPGVPIARATGSALELNLIEDHLLGVLGVASGIATRAAAIVRAAPVGLRVVCGAWKKLPAAMKPVLRAGLDAAGVGHRLLVEEFVYVDKNGVALLGGVREAVRAGLAVGNGPVAVQLKSPRDVAAAVAAGAGAVMIDTGSLADLRAAHAELERLDRLDVVLAFGGGARADDLVAVHGAGALVVDIGRAILDAPLLDLRFDVVVDPEEEPWPS